MFVGNGSVIDGKFELRGVVGHGGMGVVHEAHQLGLDRIVALKLLSCVPEESKDEVVRFEREALILSKLSHGNIVQFYAYGTWDGFPYIAMELLVGDSLQKLLTRDESLPLPDSIEYVRRICDGLEHAHAHGVIHRDIKPTNIILISGPDGRLIPKIIDFGLAKLTGIGIQQLTKTNAAVGSVLYMSPEQCTGQPVDHRSDIYSLGCLLYHCLTGKPPHCADNAVAVMFQQVNEPVQNTSGWHRLPGALQSIVARCVAKDPADRFQSCGELRDNLKLAALSESIALSISSPNQPVSSLTKLADVHAVRPESLRKKLLIVPAIATAVILTGGAVWYTAHKSPLPTGKPGQITYVGSPKETMTSILHRYHRKEETLLSPVEVAQLAQALEQFRSGPEADADANLLLSVYETLARHYDATGQVEKLRSALINGLDISPRATDFIDYVHLLVRYHWLCARSDTELSLVDKLKGAKQRFPAMAFNERNEVDLMLGQDYMKLRRDSEARQAILSVVNSPTYSDGQIDRGKFLLKQLDDRAVAIKQIKLLSKQLDEDIKAKRSTFRSVHSLVRQYQRINKDSTELILQNIANPAMVPFDRLRLQYELGQSYLEQGDQSKCEQIWKQMLEPMRKVMLPTRLPNAFGIYYLTVFGLARIYLQTGNYRECISLIEQWRKDGIGPDTSSLCDTNLTVYRAHAYRHIGKLADAEKLYLRAIMNLDRAIEMKKANPDSTCWRIDSRCGLACSLYLRGQYKEASEVSNAAVTEAIKMHASFQATYCELVHGACLEKLNRVQDAATSRQKAMVQMAHMKPDEIRKFSYIFDDVVLLASVVPK